jgi:hypothetical protein
MEYVRLVKPDWFDHEARGEGEFMDYAFKKSNDGTGMSVFEVECAEAENGLICEHARKYYSDFIRDDQPVFCILSDKELPPRAEAKMTDDPDPCHRGIDATNTKGKPIGSHAFKDHFRLKRDWKNFFICENGAHRALTMADIADWKLKKALADMA